MSIRLLTVLIGLSLIIMGASATIIIRLDAENERVAIINDGPTAIDMTGWYLKDDTDPYQVFPFPPSFLLQPWSQVILHAGSGQNTATDQFWARDAPVWTNEGGDIAALYNAQGEKIADSTGFSHADAPGSPLTSAVQPEITPVRAQSATELIIGIGKRYTIGDPGSYLRAAIEGTGKTATRAFARPTLKGSTGPYKPGEPAYGVTPPDRPYVRWYPAARWGMSISKDAYYVPPTPAAVPTYSVAPTYAVTPTSSSIYATAQPTIVPSIHIQPTITIQSDPSVATDPRLSSFPFILRGNSNSIPITLYGGLNAYLNNHPPKFTGDYQTYYQDFINEPNQRLTIQTLAQSLGSHTGLNDDARAAISLVQHIPYDWPNYNAGTPKSRYPYQVLYDNTGVCGEKSILLASLLKELGYGVALLKFGLENHMVVGIRCPVDYAYKGTGYAFVEATEPTIPTDAEGGYGAEGSIKLSSIPMVFPIAEGDMFETISEEAGDARQFEEQKTTYLATGRMPNSELYRSLLTKYGIRTTRT